MHSTGYHGLFALTGGNPLLSSRDNIQNKWHCNSIQFHTTKYILK